MPPSDSSSGRIFVSSTCYDLLDLRAQLEVALTDAGLRPVMSDRSTSEFSNPGATNSIETCLVNLRSCERCIVILSRRYGASLKAAGFDDVSATHLEYREALQCGLPVTFYVRDRLLGEYELWRQNKPLKTLWAEHDDAERLFLFISEHRKLENSDKSNYVQSYVTGNDLCPRVLTDLGATASAARIRMLTEQNQLPILSLQHFETEGRVCKAFLTNVGGIPALRVSVCHPLGNRMMVPFDLIPGQKQLFCFQLGTDVFSRYGGHLPVFLVDYEIPNGDRLRDLFAILPPKDDIFFRIVPAGRNVIGRSLRSNVPTVADIRGCRMVPGEPINAAHTSREC